MAVNSFEIIPMNEWGLFTDPKPSVVAGPCSAESEEQVLETAKHLKETGINVYRAGIWKPRTHPGSFEGVGAEGLAWMQRAKKEYGLKIAEVKVKAVNIASSLGVKNFEFTTGKTTELVEALKKILNKNIDFRLSLVKGTYTITGIKVLS